MKRIRPILCSLGLGLAACGAGDPTTPPSGEGRMVLSGDLEVPAGYTAVVHATGISPGRSGAVFALGTVTFESSDTSIARILRTTEVGNFNQRFEARVVTRREGVVEIRVSSTRTDSESWELTVLPCPGC